MSNIVNNKPKAMKVIKNAITVQGTNRPLPLLTPVPGQRAIVSKGNKVALPTLEGISFQKLEKIVSLEAQGNYTCIHLIDGRNLLVCKTLRDMEDLISHHFQFVRIHRSFTINLDHIAKYIKGKGGYVKMEDGSTYNVSVGRKPAFIKALHLYFG